jgi:ribosomal-protein-alanine N-acetyltransferase
MMTEEPTLRPRRASDDDLSAIMAIERQSFTNPWTRDMVQSELTHPLSTVLVGEALNGQQKVIHAFAIFWQVADEIHLLNLATDGAMRRRGFGRAMLAAVLSAGREHACRVVILEVRVSNAPAQALYLSSGFRRVGLRPKYYRDNEEDAVNMILDL